MKKTNLSFWLALLPVLLFTYTAASKWLNMPRFTASMEKQPFPSWLQAAVVWGLPPAEMLVAGLLLFPKTRLAGFAGFSGLMVLFAGYTAAILLHVFPYVPCTCGGVISELGWPLHTILNLFFLCLGIAGTRQTIVLLHHLNKQV